MKFAKLFSFLLILPITLLFAQDESEVEEVVVVGSQIKGAKITGALPVSVITAEDIEGLAIESGEELFQELAENGGNNFNQTDFSGGYNAARGDVGSLDLRNIGTGNTVTLLNGRRLVQTPGYSTEWVGGSYVPVNSVNSNTIPVYGAERVEILRDGAAAIYGADAVAGVINTVLKSDYEGATVRVRTNWYDSFEAKDNKVSIQFGKDFANGTNVSVYFDRYDRERIRASEDPKWATDDIRHLRPEHLSSWNSGSNSTAWRNSNIRSPYAQFYVGSSKNIYSIYPSDSNKCDGSYSKWDQELFYYFPGYEGQLCLYDSSSSTQRANYGDTYDKRVPLLRNNLVVFVNTELDNGVEAYSEISLYKSDINRVLYPSANLGLGNSSRNGANTQPFYIPASNYWFQQLRQGALSTDGSASVYDWTNNPTRDDDGNLVLDINGNLVPRFFQSEEDDFLGFVIIDLLLQEVTMQFVKHGDLFKALEEPSKIGTGIQGLLCRGNI